MKTSTWITFSSRHASSTKVRGRSVYVRLRWGVLIGTSAAHHTSRSNWERENNGSEDTSLWIPAWSDETLAFTLVCQARLRQIAARRSQTETRSSETVGARWRQQHRGRTDGEQASHHDLHVAAWNHHRTQGFGNRQAQS